jgi:metallophosphoesterase superfamily enzyme
LGTAAFLWLTQLVLRHAPRVVVALGDNFHDGGGPSRMQDRDRSALVALQRGREWIWITGNHDGCITHV